MITINVIFLSIEKFGSHFLFWLSQIFTDNYFFNDITKYFIKLYYFITLFY